MSKIKHAIILAAGRGTRLIPITNKVPKGLVKINNQTLILRGIKKIRNFIKNIHITVGYKGSMMAEHVIKNKVSILQWKLFYVYFLQILFYPRTLTKRNKF